MVNVRKNRMAPGYDGQKEEVPIQVENPYQKGEYEVVTRNIRECSLLIMRQRKQIDEAQLRAAEWVQGKMQRSRMSSGAIDPSYEPVDTSGHPDPIPNRVIAAAQELSKARKHIGEVSWPLLELVCGDGHTIQSAANKRYGLATAAQIKFTGRLLRETLDTLARYLGYIK